MSKLITNTIRHTGGSADNITLDNSQNVTCESNLTIDGTVGIQNDRSYAHAEADQLIIGNYSTDAHQGMTILSHTSKAGTIYFGDGDNPNGNARGTIVYNHADDALKFGTAGGNERLRIDSSGNVGIGESAPEELLHITHASAPAIQLESTSGGPYKSLIKMSGNDMEIRGSNGQIQFFQGNADGDSSSEKLRISSHGGITFNGDTAAANCLDDYEEGSFTLSPNLVSVSTSHNTFVYVKIGRLVTFTGRLDYSSSGGTSDQILGLPYTVSSGDYYNAMTANFYVNDGLSVGSEDYLVGYCSAGTTRLHMTTQATATQYNLPSSADFYVTGMYYTDT